MKAMVHALQYAKAWHSWAYKLVLHDKSWIIIA